MCRVISTPTLWTDDVKAQITVSQLTKHLLHLKIDMVSILIQILDTLEVYT